MIKETWKGKRPMTTAELFDVICDILKEAGKLPEILDYKLPTNRPMPIDDYSFDFGNNLIYGGNEGIYLGMYIVTKSAREHLGTFKTLNESDEAMHTMGNLLADFIVYGVAYVNTHLDDFTWNGYDVDYINSEGKRIGGYSCGSKESAIRKANDLLTRQPQIIIRDNKTRKETVYREGDEICLK